MIGLLALLAPLALTPQGEAARTLDTVHLFKPPATLDAWIERRALLRMQVLFASGLWDVPSIYPAPEPVIRSPVERDGYTVWKVCFASLPGHYVTGNLYEPAGDVKAGVLSPHGHWESGRFCELADEEGNDRWPIQARCAQLARMGCVVLCYDMVGYGDSTAIPHEAFADADAILDGMSLLGLQLLNSFQALNVLQRRPGVRRIGMTGASGGGTQTFLLCAASDRRIDAAFPAVMVSNRMQGGCACENAPYLRLGTDNVELAALFAPRPVAMSGANDWTIAIETEGLPELRQVWGLYGAADKVSARCWPELPHNFGHESRAMMYAWFDEHLELGAGRGPGGDVVEAPIVPLTRDELSVFDAEHPRPADEGGVEAVRAWWRERVAERDRQPRSMLPGDIVWQRDRARVTLRGRQPSIQSADETVMFVTGPDGDPEYERVVERIQELATCEVRRISPPKGPAPRDEGRHASYAGYSWCYNPPDLVRRARRIAAQLATVSDQRLLAFGAEARAGALASAIGPWPSRVVIASTDWFEPRTDLDDRDFLPSERAVGGLAALLAVPCTYAPDPDAPGPAGPGWPDRDPPPPRPEIRLVGANAIPEVYGRPLTDERLVETHAELDDAVLSWLVAE